MYVTFFCSFEKFFFKKIKNLNGLDKIYLKAYEKSNWMCVCLWVNALLWRVAFGAAVYKRTGPWPIRPAIRLQNKPLDCKQLSTWKAAKVIQNKRWRQMWNDVWEMDDIMRYGSVRCEREHKVLYASCVGCVGV